MLHFKLLQKCISKFDLDFEPEFERLVNTGPGEGEGCVVPTFIGQFTSGNAFVHMQTWEEPLWLRIVDVPRATMGCHVRDALTGICVCQTVVVDLVDVCAVIVMDMLIHVTQRLADVWSVIIVLCKDLVWLLFIFDWISQQLSQLRTVSMHV